MRQITHQTIAALYVLLSLTLGLLPRYVSARTGEPLRPDYSICLDTLTKADSEGPGYRVVAGLGGTGTLFLTESGKTYRLSGETEMQIANMRTEGTGGISILADDITLLTGDRDTLTCSFLVLAGNVTLGGISSGGSGTLELRGALTVFGHLTVNAGVALRILDFQPRANCHITADGEVYGITCTLPDNIRLDGTNNSILALSGLEAKSGWSPLSLRGDGATTFSLPFDGTSHGVFRLVPPGRYTVTEKGGTPLQAWSGSKFVSDFTTEAGKLQSYSFPEASPLRINLAGSDLASVSGYYSVKDGDITLLAEGASFLLSGDGSKRGLRCNKACDITLDGDVLLNWLNIDGGSCTLKGGGEKARLFITNTTGGNGGGLVDKYAGIYIRPGSTTDPVSLTLRDLEAVSVGRYDSSIKGNSLRCDDPGSFRLEGDCRFLGYDFSSFSYTAYPSAIVLGKINSSQGDILLKRPGGEEVLRIAMSNGAEKSVGLIIGDSGMEGEYALWQGQGQLSGTSGHGERTQAFIPGKRYEFVCGPLRLDTVANLSGKDIYLYNEGGSNWTRQQGGSATYFDGKIILPEELKASLSVSLYRYEEEATLRLTRGKISPPEGKVALTVSNATPNDQATLRLIAEGPLSLYGREGSDEAGTAPAYALSLGEGTNCRFDTSDDPGESGVFLYATGAEAVHLGERAALWGLRSFTLAASPTAVAGTGKAVTSMGGEFPDGILTYASNRGGEVDTFSIAIPDSVTIQYAIPGAAAGEYTSHFPFADADGRYAAYTGLVPYALLPGEGTGEISIGADMGDIRQVGPDTESGTKSPDIKIDGVGKGSTEPKELLLSNLTSDKLTLDGEANLLLSLTGTSRIGEIAVGPGSSLTLNRQTEGDFLEITSGVSVNGPATVIDSTGYVRSVSGPEGSTLMAIERDPADASASPGSTLTLSASVKVGTADSPTAVWQRQGADGTWADLPEPSATSLEAPALRSSAGEATRTFTREVSEAGLYRCLITNVVTVGEVKTSHVTLATRPAAATFAQTPPPPPAPASYTVSLPAVEGALLTPSAGKHTVTEGSGFTFTLLLEEGYGRSEPVVTVSSPATPETLVPEELPDGSLRYTVPSVWSDLDISIAGIVRDIPTSIAGATVPEARVWVAGGQLRVYSPVPARVSLYSYGGTLISDRLVPAGEITLRAPSGPCIVRVGDKVFKVVR